MATEADTEDTTPSRKVRLQLPTGHERGFRESLANRSQFDVADLGDNWVGIEPASAESKRWFVAHRLAGADDNLADTARWAPVFEHPPYRPKPPVTLPPEMQRHFEELHTRTDLRSVMQRMSATAAQLQDRDLPALFQREMPALFNRYPAGSLWYVSVDDVLISRLAFMRLRLQLEFTPDVDYEPGRRDRVRYFGLHTSTGGVSFENVLDHALLFMPPVAVGVTFGVFPHAFVFLFGEPHDLRLRQDQPFAQLYYPSVGRTPRGVPGIQFPIGELPTTHLESFLQWWTTRLDVVYGYAADPTNFATDDREHDVAAQAAWFFTLERLMADVTALLSTVNAPELLRMQVAFDLLDKADSLLVPKGKDAEGKNFKRLLRRSEALPRLERSFQRLPLQLRSRFIRWANESYDRLYDDIAAGTMKARREKRGIRVAMTDPHDPKLMLWDDYVPAVMRTARNSSHGLQTILRSAPKKAGKPDPRLLMATTDGEVPQSFYEVATVVFFALLADAERVCDGTWWDE